VQGATVTFHALPTEVLPYVCHPLVEFPSKSETQQLWEDEPSLKAAK
jgi:hypothetical protein